MATSQNGYSANDISVTSVRKIPGTERSVRLRNGPAGDLLLWVASQFDRLVEDIDPGQLDDWGYAPRTIRGSTTVLSNHASGTALDLNATRHPRGTKPSANFSQHQIDTIHAIIAATEGCVRWGGDYVAPALKDGMHFEIVAPEARCAAVYAKLNPKIDWTDMASQQEFSNAMFDAMNRYLSSDEVRFEGSNWADMVLQIRLSIVGLQTQVDTLSKQLVDSQAAVAAGLNNLAEAIQAQTAATKAAR